MHDLLDMVPVEALTHPPQEYAVTRVSLGLPSGVGFVAPLRSDVSRELGIKRYLVILATRWGPQLGGINSLNQDLCSALAATLTHHGVVCLVLQASQREIDHAHAQGVRLISIDGADEFPSDVSGVRGRLAQSGVGESDVDWVVGHDVKTGFAARALAATLGCRAAAVMHMSYGDYSHVKSGGSGAREKERLQKELFGGIDEAFAIGPLLYERLVEIRGAKSATRLIPGLPEPLNGLPTARVSAVSFGRLEADESLVKQAPLVIAGFGAAVDTAKGADIDSFKDPRLKLIGIPKSEHKAVRKLAERHAKRLLNLELVEYIESREILRQHLEDCNLALMLSWHEGFGLSGWEAIGHGIPLILSTNSGVFRLLDEIGGNATGCVMSLDIRATAGTGPAPQDKSDLQSLLIRFSQRLRKQCADARQLSSMLRTQCGYTWQNCAGSLAKSLGLPVRAADTIGLTQLHSALLHDKTDLRVVALRRLLNYAEILTDQGEYEQALSKLDQLEANGVTQYHELRVSFLIRKANCVLRLNRYSDAQLIADEALTGLSEEMAAEHIEALGILNVINRDRGLYIEAIAQAREMLEIAEARCPERIGHVQRKLARSLAVSGEWAEAASLAESAIKVAKDASIDHAKALLALGEAFRHGLDQERAISSYVGARDLASMNAHTDCWLWANLGLADSLFLVGDLNACTTVLTGLQEYIGTSKQSHPLEELHLALSNVAVATVSNGQPQDAAAVQALLKRYAELEILWPREYLSQISTPGARLPKRL